MCYREIKSIERGRLLSCITRSSSGMSWGSRLEQCVEDRYGRTQQALGKFE
jgi:hypothetical protein